MRLLTYLLLANAKIMFDKADRKLMKNMVVADDMNMRADEMLVQGNELADSIYETVMDKVR